MLPLSLVSFTFILGCLGLGLNRAHLLSALLCLELLLVSLFSGMAIWATSTFSCPLTSATTLLLALSACEASTGLALLVSISRTHGADLIRTLNLLQC
uniref:NADH-ubiquinone oxidoreductase chain 4L n=1 Tax=Schizocardium brasiliense TaxID=1443243 RepID=A0A3Q8HFY8_9BILA|nr:NADH dehydrogenase subunit 4L [Schizocardium brasiliense]AXY64134.1 NADH dehydrogenase subunit 4L [Schizocardium brasiliense]